MLLEWNQKALPSWQTTTRWKPNNNKQTREKVTGGDERYSVASGKNNATTGHTSRQRWRHIVHAWIYESWTMGPFSCSDSQRTLPASIRFWSVVCSSTEIDAS
jgi:hypothetical protein